MKLLRAHDREELFFTPKGDLLFAVAACAAAFAAFLVFSLASISRETVQLLMQGGVLLVLAGGVLWTCRRPDCDKVSFWLRAIFLLGVIMRIGYMLYTPATLRAHDVGYFDDTGAGNAGYVRTLLSGKLPGSYQGQFYHPPLFHILGACAVKLYSFTASGLSYREQFEAVKLVSCCASILTLMFAGKLLHELGVGKKAQLFALGLTAFYPHNYLLIGYSNNDALAIMFMTGILYYTVRWYHRQDWNVIVKLALCFGLGMMSKLSVVLFALITGPVMLFILFRQWKEKRRPAVLSQYEVFALISFPLGLWYPLRNYLKFGQPLSYVLRFSEQSTLYCGDHSLWERFGLVMVAKRYNAPSNDYNIWHYILRGGLFGEYGFSVGTILPLLFLLVNLLLILLSLYAMCRVLIRRPKELSYWMLLGFWAVLLISYISFNVQYPFGCTMDFRYIAPTATIGAVFLAVFCEDRSESRLLWRVSEILTVAFSVLSIVMYTNIV